MAMPRRAMKDLGFQACCLRCDASDVVGSERCRSCITHHKGVREQIAKAPQSNELFQLARDLLAMAASPNRYDHDEVHGPSLREQQLLANSLVEAKPLPTSEDISELFAAQAKRKKTSVVQTVGNQNPWKDQLPTEEVMTHMAESLEAEDIAHGARTIPSRTIAPVDRSDRLGEDRKMVDKIEAEKAAIDAPEPLKDIVESATIAQRKRDRKDWEDAQSGVSELLDGDLDL
jgi:ribosomal protein L40E|tara:strand:+ start:407 stop:1099 length:693 start_codon:yes stop_codon:yes gene_type:complete